MPFAGLCTAEEMGSLWLERVFAPSSSISSSVDDRGAFQRASEGDACARVPFAEDTPRERLVASRKMASVLNVPPIFYAMFVHDITLRVRYGETDQMGYVYYGNYAEYLEVGRVEALRTLGFPYRRLEEEGVMLPVRELAVRYHAPARYDDLITVRTFIDELPTARIHFRYEVRSAANELLTEASTTLVFVDRATMRPTRAPKDLVDALRSLL